MEQKELELEYSARVAEQPPPARACAGIRYLEQSPC